MRRTTRTDAATIILITLAAGSCGGSTPTSPSMSLGAATGSSGAIGGPTTAAIAGCRTLPSTYRVVSTAGPVTSTINGSCTFNPATVEGTCTNEYSDTAGQAFTSVSTTRNTSIADVVDEVSVIPPLNLSLTTTTTLTFAGQAPITSSATRTYAGRRILTNTSTGVGVTAVTTYTAWDASDRPLEASVSTNGLAIAQTFTYDNTTRTQTMTQAGLTCSQTFDQNGNPLLSVCPGSSTNFTMLTTQDICR